MRSIMRLLPIIALLTVACEPKEVEETVWDDQIKTMDKAREVEDKLQNRADQLGKEIEEQTNRKDPP